MMNNQPFDNQLQMFGQMAKQSGISGEAYIDVDPASGSLRMKLKVTPAEEQAKLISAIAYVLAQVPLSQLCRLFFQFAEAGLGGADRFRGALRIPGTLSTGAAAPLLPVNRRWKERFG